MWIFQIVWAGLIFTGALLYWRQMIRRQRNLEELLREKDRELAVADELAGFACLMAVHRSSDSFTGTVPHRAAEVVRNDALSKAASLAVQYLTVRGKARPEVQIPDEAFRPLGGGIVP